MWTFYIDLMCAPVRLMPYLQDYGGIALVSVRKWNMLLITNKHLILKPLASMRWGTDVGWRSKNHPQFSKPSSHFHLPDLPVPVQIFSKTLICTHGFLQCQKRERPSQNVCQKVVTTQFLSIIIYDVTGYPHFHLFQAMHRVQNKAIWDNPPHITLLPFYN